MVVEEDAFLGIVGLSSVYCVRISASYYSSDMQQIILVY